MLFTSNGYVYPSTPSTPSVRADSYSYREILRTYKLCGSKLPVRDRGNTSRMQQGGIMRPLVLMTRGWRAEEAKRKYPQVYPETSINHFYLCTLPAAQQQHQQLISSGISSSSSMHCTHHTAKGPENIRRSHEPLLIMRSYRARMTQQICGSRENDFCRDHNP